MNFKEYRRRRRFSQWYHQEDEDRDVPSWFPPSLIVWIAFLVSGVSIYLSTQWEPPPVIEFDGVFNCPNGHHAHKPKLHHGDDRFSVSYECWMNH